MSYWICTSNPSKTQIPVTTQTQLSTFNSLLRDVKFQLHFLTVDVARDSARRSIDFDEDVPLPVYNNLLGVAVWVFVQVFHRPVMRCQAKDRIFQPLQFLHFTLE